MFAAHICIFVRDDAIQPTVLARAVEERGFDGLFVAENTHMPIQRRRPAPYPEERMRSLASLYDPFVTLGACAAVTHRIKLGISVCLLTHRDVIATARNVSSLDTLSNGRLILGVAGGVVAEAMENHGSPFKDRWRIVREKTLAMRTIWEDTHPEFHGDFVNFEPFVSTMEPQQRGGPPVWIGSNHKGVADRVAEYGDGWIVFEERYAGDPFADINNACDQVGRDPEEITLALMDAPHDEHELSARLAMGYRSFIFIAQGTTQNELLNELDDLSAKIDKLRHGEQTPNTRSTTTQPLQH